MSLYKEHILPAIIIVALPPISLIIYKEIKLTLRKTAIKRKLR